MHSCCLGNDATHSGLNQDSSPQTCPQVNPKQTALIKILFPGDFCVVSQSTPCELYTQTHHFKTMSFLLLPLCWLLFCCSKKYRDQKQLKEESYLGSQFQGTRVLKYGTAG